jgi:hypothetical protein
VRQPKISRKTVSTGALLSIRPVSAAVPSSRVSGKGRAITTVEKTEANRVAFADEAAHWDTAP